MASSSSPTAMTHDYGPDSGGRVKGVKFVKPVVVGNTAKYFGKKRESDGHTHSWKVFLKPYIPEDYSCFIKKVQFKLHESYPNPNRILTKPPYEIEETGWGEFEIAVKIHFNDPVERPVTVYHVLKLFEVNKDPTGPPIIVKAISSETYDEIVFLEPTRLMKALLESVKPIKTNWKPETDFEAKKKSSLQSINAARSIVKNEIEQLKNRLKLSRETIDVFKKKLEEAQESADEDDSSSASSTSGSSKPIPSSSSTSSLVQIGGPGATSMRALQGQQAAAAAAASASAVLPKTDVVPSTSAGI